MVNCRKFDRLLKCAIGGSHVALDVSEDGRRPLYKEFYTPPRPPGSSFSGLNLNIAPKIKTKVEGLSLELDPTIKNQVENLDQSLYRLYSYWSYPDARRMELSRRRARNIMNQAIAAEARRKALNLEPGPIRPLIDTAKKTPPKMRQNVQNMTENEMAKSLLTPEGIGRWLWSSFQEKARRDRDAKLLARPIMGPSRAPSAPTPDSPSPLAENQIPVPTNNSVRTPNSGLLNAPSAPTPYPSSPLAGYPLGDLGYSSVLPADTGLLNAPLDLTPYPSSPLAGDLLGDLGYSSVLPVDTGLLNAPSSPTPNPPSPSAENQISGPADNPVRTPDRDLPNAPSSPTSNPPSPSAENQTPGPADNSVRTPDKGLPGGSGSPPRSSSWFGPVSDFARKNPTLTSVLALAGLGGAGYGAYRYFKNRKRRPQEDEQYDFASEPYVIPIGLRRRQAN